MNLSRKDVPNQACAAMTGEKGRQDATSSGPELSSPKFSRRANSTLSRAASLQDDAAEVLLSPQPRVLKLVWQDPVSPSGRTVPPSLPDSPKATRFPPPDVLQPDHENAQLLAKGTLKMAAPLVRRVTTAAGRQPTEMRRAVISATRPTRCWGLPLRDLLQFGQEDALATKNTDQPTLDWVGELFSRPAQPGLHAPHQIRIAPHLIRSVDSRSASPSPESSPAARGRSRSGKLLKSFPAAGDRSGATSSGKSLATAKKLRTTASAVHHSIGLLRDVSNRRLLGLERSRSGGEALASRPVTASVRLPSSSPGTPLQRAPSLFAPWQNEFPTRRTSSGPELPSPKFLRRSNSTLSRADSL